MCKIQKTETFFFSYQSSKDTCYEWVYNNIMLLYEFMKVFFHQIFLFKIPNTSTLFFCQEKPQK